MFEFVVIIICLILNAILSCVEMAFVTVSRPHLKKLAAKGDTLAQRLILLKSNPERVLSVLQIGITLVGAISAAVGGVGAKETLGPFLQSTFGASEDVSEVIAIVSVVIPLTFFSVVIGELVPKTLALRYPMRFAKLGGTFLHILDRIFAPLVFLFEISTKVIMKLFLSRLKTESLYEVSTSVEIDSLSDLNKQYVLNLIDVDKRKVKDIMLPWEDAVKVAHDLRPFEVLEIIKKSGHTRIPVLQDETPIGVLHSKEFIAESEIARIDWMQLVRPAIYMNADEPILNALKTLQTRKSHMAIVIADSKPIGIVTMEDVFEEVVGEIYDEDDNPQILLSSNSRIRTMNLPKK